MSKNLIINLCIYLFALISKNILWSKKIQKGNKHKQRGVGNFLLLLKKTLINNNDRLNTNQ